MTVLEQSDYAATCKDGNKYHVYENDKAVSWSIVNGARSRASCCRNSAAICRSKGVESVFTSMV